MVDILIVTALLVEREAVRDALSTGVDGMHVAQWSLLVTMSRPIWSATSRTMAARHFVLRWEGQPIWVQRRPCLSRQP